jgi:hypothetical protein
MATAVKDPETTDGKPALEAVPDPDVVDEGQLVLFEGQPIHGYRLSFSGNIELADEDTIAALTLGQEVTLKVKGYVSGRGHQLKRGKDTGKRGAISKHTLVVESVAPSK